MSPRFFCVGPCWEDDCECRVWHGMDARKVPRVPPLHDGCSCVIAEEVPKDPEPLLFVRCRACLRRSLADRGELEVGILDDGLTLVVLCRDHGPVGKFELAEPVGTSCACFSEAAYGC